ncbi:MAG: S-layer homology domain-containing protein, partial [Patescibacteria group bacterium]
DVDPLTDVGKAANALYESRVIGGYPDKEFKGGRLVNRAEASKFLILATGRGENMVEKNNNRFSDVYDGEWYMPYVMTAAEHGIIAGDPGGTFRPGDSVNTAEFAKMLSLAFDLPLNLPFSYSNISTDDWFAPYAGIIEEYGLLPGREGLLQPSRPMTRAEVALAIFLLSQRE